jgi:pimeloyl-ACP methyl ester carboxylesterase
MSSNNLVGFLALILIFSLTVTMTTSITTHFTPTHAQTSSDCNYGLVMPNRDINTIHVAPVILIHGYIENAVAWSQWEQWLQDDGIPFCTATFVHSNEPLYDPCGTATSHANELSEIVQKVKSYALEKHLPVDNLVNIVGHSKGGLDARVYLDNTATHDVANLVMIGTPNGGDALADSFVPYSHLANSIPYGQSWASMFCTPALDDLTTYATDIKAKENTHTRYYTIYGNWTPTTGSIFPWIPSSNNCPQPPASSVGKWAWLYWPAAEGEGYYNLNNYPNDGIVPASSVESLPNYRNHINLGSTPDCHTNLLSRPEYDLAKSVLTAL